MGDLATVTESTLADDLAPGLEVRRHLLDQAGARAVDLARGRAVPRGRAWRQKEYVDYAARRGWPYVVVDAGWYFDRSSGTSPTPTGRRNSWIPELVRYAGEKGVGIQVWIHHRDLDTAEEREQWLPTLESGA